MKILSHLSRSKLAILIAVVLSITLLPGCSSESAGLEDSQSSAAVEDQNESDNSAEENPSDGMSSFQTRDIYGNEVNQDIFQGYDLTLVNVWGTFCGPCLEEMPYLGELQKEYSAKGVNVVGIVCDVQDENLEIIDEQIDIAKDIVDQTGADYTHMLVSLDMIDPVMSRFDAIPASFFVDSYGNIISEFYIGSKSKADWEALIEENLESVQ